MGISADFNLEGRLPLRPLAPLDRELEAHGIRLSRPEPGLLQCRGRLQPGAFTLPGNVSSQFISGLLFALPLLEGESTLTVTGPVESGPYLEMTQAALALFGIHIPFDGTSYFISPTPYQSPGLLQLEGDWSNAAFWLCGGALGGGITVSGLRRDSLQGDPGHLSPAGGIGRNPVLGARPLYHCARPSAAHPVDARPIQIWSPSWPSRLLQPLGRAEWSTRAGSG